MEIAIVTGSERGIGLKIAQRLIGMGFKVYGLAQSFRDCHFDHKYFSPISCDLTSGEQVARAYDLISDRDPDTFCLVNAAQHDPGEAFEATRIESIDYAVQTGLLTPLILTRLALPSLIRLRGHILNICWNGRDSIEKGALGCAIEGGLMHFGNALFDEVRDTGVKVTLLTPQPNTGERDPKGKLRLQPQSEVDPNLFADAVESVLRFKGTNLVSEIVVRPQATREEPLVPLAIPDLPRAKHDVQLPPPAKMAPLHEGGIPTPEARRPEDAPDPTAAEQAEGADDDDDDDELDELMEESRILLEKEREFARQKVKKAERRHLPAPPPTPDPRTTQNQPEQDSKEVDAARERFAQLLGIDHNETRPDNPKRQQDRQGRLDKTARTDSETVSESPEDKRDGPPNAGKPQEEADQNPEDHDSVSNGLQTTPRVAEPASEPCADSSLNKAPQEVNDGAEPETENVVATPKKAAKRATKKRATKKRTTRKVSKPIKPEGD